MDFWGYANGFVILEITSADPAGMISAIQDIGITLENVRFLDELTFQFQIKRQDRKRVLALASKRDVKCTVKRSKGLYWNLKSLFRRPVLIIGLVLICLLTVYLPTRILFFRVQGNVSIPDKRIMELTSQSGIHFGVSRREIRSEKVKNQLLSTIPELEWVGINTSGCVATISVRERQTKEEVDPFQGVSSIVASRDGVVQELTVISGTAACKTGQVVKAGQVLISGYTDCGLSIRAERARGEVYAVTNRHFTCLMPEIDAQRGMKTRVVEKNSLIIGKKRINFFKDSGILDTGCVKMYSENYVTLPGGFVLPVAFVTETWINYEPTTVTVNTVQDEMLLSQFVQAYLRTQMIAGTILSQSEDFSQENDVVQLSGHYACQEMIGRERIEEIIAP